MKKWVEVGGYVAFGIIAGVILRGIYDQERRKLVPKVAAVAAVRG